MSKAYFLFTLLFLFPVYSNAFGFISSIAYRRALIPSVSMGLDPALTKLFPRDFKNIPKGTDYGTGNDEALNIQYENRRLDYLESELQMCLKEVVASKQRPIFTTALITGDCVILDAIHKAGVLDKIPVIFVDTYTLFPETLAFLREVENHYGFKAKVYAAAGCADQNDYYDKYGRDYWMKDIDEYDKLCKVEPMNRALSEANSDGWINGRRRDHGAERAALPVWENKKVNPLAMWTFEDCWAYCRHHKVPYHPLHDVGFSSLGDMHRTVKDDPKDCFTYGGERSGRFQNLINKDGSSKTECGIHTEIKADLSMKK
jgi:phosphoadenosine phosphosulfate reductase